jgi:hypothetical protein
MFEYLMPPLLVRSYEGTLLNQIARAVVAHQVRYGREQRVPWGISESGYYRFDNNRNYQYQAFGVPGLGYKRGLEEDLVVTPYASFISMPFAPAAVFENFERFKAYGMLGTYGLFEAVDFTTRRLPPGEPFAVIRSYMAHHQGMLLVALANHLHDGRMVERFHRNARIQSVENLLQEQVPVDAPLVDARLDRLHQAPDVPEGERTKPWSVPARTVQPRPHLLSNGSYSVFITNSGSGFSRWQETDLTRWRRSRRADRDWWRRARVRSHGWAWWRPRAGFPALAADAAGGPER